MKEYRRLKVLRRGSTCANSLKRDDKKIETIAELGGRRVFKPETVQTVEEEIHSSTGDQHASARSVGRTFSIPWATEHKALCCFFKLYPYQISILKEINPQKPQQRIDFSKFIL